MLQLLRLSSRRAADPGILGTKTIQQFIQGIKTPLFFHSIGGGGGGGEVILNVFIALNQITHPPKKVRYTPL